MYFFIAIIFFLVFVLTCYGLYDSKFNWLQKFDLMIVSTVAIFIIARVLGFIAQYENLDLEWSLGAIREIDGNIEIFNTWPWVFLRFWDEIYLWNYPVLIFIGVAILCQFLFKFNLEKLRSFLNIYTLAYLVAIIFSLLGIILFSVFGLIDFEMNQLITWLAVSVIVLAAGLIVKAFKSNKSFEIAMMTVIIAKIVIYIAKLPGFESQNLNISILESAVVVAFILIIWNVRRVRAIFAPKDKNLRRQRIQRQVINQ